MAQTIVLFDGVCNLCNTSVQFIINRDPGARFQFASLQSAMGQQLLREHQIDPGDESIVLVENGRAYTHSTAALRIARWLSGGWSLFYGFVLVPTFIRDAAYRVVVHNRYRWFGKQELCMIPTPALRKRFLD